MKGGAAVWRHIAQSVQGLHHSADGIPCQDHCLVRLFGDEPDSALVACVADGAGYSPHSDIGSALACESIVQSAAAHFETKRTFANLEAGDVLQWCDTARDKIYHCAERDQRQPRDYATTLCAAVVSDRRSVFFQVGDGAIVVRKNAVCGVVFWPQSGEYINTTTFLTSAEYRDRLAVATTAAGFSDVALFTDGIERLALKFDSLTPHLPFFQPLFGALRAASNVEALAGDLGRLLQSDSVRNKTDDDKTLVLASRISHHA